MGAPAAKSGPCRTLIPLSPPAQTGSWALKCPSHGRLVDVRTGEGLEQQLDAACVSSGAVQRVHEVMIASDGSICVRLNIDSPPSLPSDTYNIFTEPAGTQTSGSRMTLAFQARKRKATEAITSKLNAAKTQAQALLPAQIAAGAMPGGAAAGVATGAGGVAAAQVASHRSGLKQMSLAAMFRGASGEGAEMMDTDDN